MALSNILREPRREITETLQGAIMFLPSTWLAWHIYGYLNNPMNWLTGEKSKDGATLIYKDGTTLIYDDSALFNIDLNAVGFHWGVFIVALSIAAVVTAVILGTLVFIHYVGDKTCDRWAEIGLDPRPKRRR
jgi:hypothetical protein